MKYIFVEHFHTGRLYYTLLFNDIQNNLPHPPKCGILDNCRLCLPIAKCGLIVGYVHVGSYAAVTGTV